MDGYEKVYTKFKEAGFATDFLISHRSSRNGDLESYPYDHVFYDGIAGFVDCLSARYGGENVNAVSLPKRKQLGWLSRKIALLSYHLMTKKLNYHYHHIAKGSEEFCSYVALSEDQTSAIMAKAKQCGVTLTAYLLSKLDEQVRSYLPNSQDELLWSIPVSLLSDFRSVKGNRSGNLLLQT